MDEQQLQQQIVQLVQAAMQGNKQATQQIQQIMQAAQQGDQQAAQLAQMIQEVAQQMQQQQVQAAKFGAKLNYIQHLKGICPEGYEMQLFKQGGQICKKCIQKAKMQNGGDIPDDNPIEAFKKRRILKARMDKIAQPGKYDKFIPSKPKNVIEGSVRSGKSNFDPNNTTLPSRNADGMQTPNRLQRSEKGSNNILIPKKPIKRDKCGSKVEMDKCGKKIKKAQYGTKTKQPIVFDRREANIGNGRRVISENIFDYDDGYGNYAGDMARTLGGRMIYISPAGNDTIYYNYPERWMPTDDSFMPVATGARNQRAAKKNFYKQTKKSVPANNNSKQARNRALKEK